MDSYRSRGDTELGLASSTQTLGVRGSSGTLSFPKEGKKLRWGLVFVCVVLLLVCIALTVYLVLYAVKDPGKKDGGKPCETNDEKRHCSSDACLEVAAALKQDMNESVDPCENFFQYSCGGWIKNNPIPSSTNAFSNFGKLAQQNNEKLLLLLLEDDDEYPNGHAVRKTKDYFKSCMAEDENDNTAADELKRLITRYGSWPLGDPATWNESTWSLTEVLVELQRNFSASGTLFEIKINANPFKSSQYILQIYPPSLSLIREKYLTTENKTRLAYLKYMTKVGELLGGGNETRQQMEKVLELEGELAKIIPPRSEINSNFHRNMNISELQRKAPGFKFTWLGFINDLLKPFNIWLNASDRVIVPSPEYLRNLSYVVNGTDKRTLSNYMMWTVVRSVVPYLSRDFLSALLEYQKETQGTKSAKPRWLSCVEDLNGYYHGLTFALGYLWVSKVFDTETIPIIQEMTTTIKKTFRDETSRYQWIDDQTRRKINEKEEAMTNKIGFPKLCGNETLLNEYYKDINISRSNYLMNALDVMAWRTRSAFSRLKTPVDKEQWFAGPQLVNAFYLPNRNEINILAGILQPPFYYGKKAPRSVNFGAIGMVLAHELSHGFDANGRYFNKDGEIIDDWWSKNTSQGFEERSKCIVDQYNKYPVNGGDEGQIHIDGKLTLSENIADNGGIRLAYWGYKDWIKNNGPEALLPGLNKTNEQLLFVSFAQMWCSVFTPSAAFTLAKTDTHALAKYRVIGSLSNLKEFSEAFKCPAGQGMNPEKKCKVW
ncbi:hypothetical protein OS493_003590 [Desmophyllum pertusum]|uniref:Endothelin-converting enzyme 1 n=1 Tax=Desmophyllum pertusum TaxID=174260 RepID=A0A9X0A5P2_9CNID|nr:hypothetical protein OS493_003590 [Desmophyllum pertusum]